MCSIPSASNGESRPDVADPTVAALAAYQAGFRDDALLTAVAIAGAESGYRPTAHNPTPPDDSYGLWQVNYYGNLRPGRTQAYGPAEGQYDPLTNARAAYSISGGGGNFKPWTTFTSGAFRSHLDEARAAVATILGSSPPAPASSGVGFNPLDPAGLVAGLPNPLDLIPDQFNPFTIGQNFVSDVGKDIITGLFRLAVYGTLLAAGGALVVLGGWRAVSQSNMYRQAKESASNVASVAAVAAA
jgi:lysozyme-like protein